VLNDIVVLSVQPCASARSVPPALADDHGLLRRGFYPALNLLRLPESTTMSFSTPVTPGRLATTPCATRRSSSVQRVIRAILEERWDNATRRPPQHLHHRIRCRAD